MSPSECSATCSCPVSHCLRRTHPPEYSERAIARPDPRCRRTKHRCSLVPRTKSHPRRVDTRSDVIVSATSWTHASSGRSTITSGSTPDHVRITCRCLEGMLATSPANEASVNGIRSPWPPEPLHAVWRVRAVDLLLLGRGKCRKVFLSVSPATHSLASRAETPRALYRNGAMT